MYSLDQENGKDTHLAKGLISVIIWPRKWQVHTSYQGNDKRTNMDKEVMVYSSSQERGNVLTWPKNC